MRASTGRIPFRVAIITVVVGLLVTTCAVLLGYGLSVAGAPRPLPHAA